jgi:hypothetical protein
MNAHRFHWLIAVLTLACFLLVAWSVPADAQKKQKPKSTTTTTATTTKDAPKEEAKEDQGEKLEKVEETAPAATPSATALPNKFLDVIKQYVGKKTNLGTLKKFAGDYMVFEDDLTTILVPLNNIQSARLVKDDETSPANLEIKLISRD